MGVLLCVSCDCGGAGDAELSVDLRTDYAPGIEFDIVRTRLDTGENEELGAVNTESSIAAFLGGQRVAEFADVDAGTRRVTVSLVRARDGETIASRDVVVAVEGSVAVTVILARGCEGIECPGAGDPAATECSAGVCVPPECTPTNPDACPTEATCTADEDCTGPALAPCAQRACQDAVCLVQRDDAVCGADQYCEPSGGCVAVPSEGDGGVPRPECEGGDLCDTGNPCEVGVTVCRDGEAVCEGDGPRPAGTECRPSTGSCDAPEVCDGEAVLCPDDVLEPGGTSCREAAGPCDVPETCTGESEECPMDQLATAGAACSSGGDAGFCDGLAVSCMTGCTPGAPCDPGVACKVGQLDCSGASPVCVVSGNEADGTTCNTRDTGSWSACAYGTTCVESGTQSRTVVTYACAAGSCASSIGSEMRACTRDTDGATCGAGFQCPSWSSCSYGGACAVAGTQTRTCTDQTCAGGACTTATMPQMQGCSRGDRTGVSCSSCGNPVCVCASTSCQTVTTTVTIDAQDGSAGAFQCAGGGSCTRAQGLCMATCPVGADIDIQCWDENGNDSATHILSDRVLCDCLLQNNGMASCNDETVTDAMDIDCYISERC
tara:strand:- start:2226 stop:4043 length:1818 start_codon:yes stop_codon:yes gene_type:complete